MWVTRRAQGWSDDDVHRMAGALSRGNTRRLRRPPGPANVQNQQHSAPANGTQIAIGGNGPARAPLCPFDAGIAPIVDGMVSSAVRRAAFGAVRTVACSVAVTFAPFPLAFRHLSQYNLIVPGVTGTLRQHTKEGGWNRKIHRATRPARYAPNRGARSADVSRTISGGAPIARTGEQDEGPRPRGVAARRRFRYP